MPLQQAGPSPYTFTASGATRTVFLLFPRAGDTVYQFLRASGDNDFFNAPADSPVVTFVMDPGDKVILLWQQQPPQFFTYALGV